MSEYNTFLEYYRKNIITESPFRTGRSFSEEMDDNAYNHTAAIEIIGNKTHIGDINVLGVDYSIYADKFENTINYFITKQPMVNVFFSFKISDGGVIMTGVWNRINAKGSARELIFNYYLKKYQFVISDKLQSTQGENYWKKLMIKAITNGYKVTVMTDKDEHDIDDVDKYWGNTAKFFNYRFKIYSK
jgi:hypothetical protein